MSAAFLEHSRIFYFANGGQEEDLPGQAPNWMQRNLDRRIEVVFPVEDEKIKQRIKNEIIQTQLNDNLGARLLNPTDRTREWRPRDGEEGIDSQQIFLQSAPPPEE
jgi:polyphosphate kinase